MKNLNYVVNGVLAIAIVILFVMQLGGKESKEPNNTVSTVGKTAVEGTLPIAYVNVDSLLMNYNYSKELNELILKKQESSRASITQKARSLQTEMEDFQRKVENNAFLTRERGEQEQQRIMKKQQELQELDNRLAQELAQEQMEMNEKLRDTIVSQLTVFNKTKGFQVIFSNTMGDNILLVSDKAKYDITPEFLEFLNKNFASAQN